MEGLVPNINKWFLQRKEYFDAFARNDTRVESWFKAELLVLLTRLKREREIEAYEREPNLYDNGGKRSQIDFSVTVNGTKHYVELKALCISQAKGTPRNLPFYFRDDEVGMMKDFKKLDRIESTNKWIIAFIYPKPDEETWDAVIGRPSHWKCLTELEDYPDHIFVALFQRTPIMKCTP
ncbi:hypothetical protein GTO27_02370 [Candidatus Bathyarchaeota archaeon]|nr:hypothetical protein [Candidatus Bathyarchaeota archaeon]